MNIRLPLLLATLFASPAIAETDYSAIFRDQGPTGAINTLKRIPDPTASDRFTLGGAQFLAALEGALQRRYAYGLEGNAFADDMGIPFLRLPIAANPTPKPFTPEAVELMFQDVLAGLSESKGTLDQITDTDTVAVKIKISDLWLDINRNRTRDVGEGLFDVAAGMISAPNDAPLPTIHFDTADAAWLAAYTQVLSGMTELILATDVTDAIEATFSGASTMDALRVSQGPLLGWFDEEDLPSLDAFAAFIVALEGQPDAIRTKAAQTHFLAAIDNNYTFWSRLAQETDNEMEFIPNDRQSSALGFDFPQGIGDSWLEVLKDAEDVLTGDLLLPHWRLGDTAGLNLDLLLNDPPNIDIIGLFHGYSLAPYAQTGPVITFESLRSFDDITGGNSPFFAIMLN